MPCKPYNGHRSWNAWNVSLWLNNDEGLYRQTSALVRAHGIGKAARIMARNLSGQRTPDGARFNPTAIRAALTGWEA